MRKGFTLVELAIVLVIIGLIAGMAIKGRELINIAKVKSEMHKLVKFQSAFAIYYARHDSMPTAVMHSGAASIYPELLFADGLLTPKDLDCDYLSARHKWFFDRVNYYKWNGYTIFHHAERGELVAAQPLDERGQGNNFRQRLSCFVENELDDRNVFRGEARHIDGRRHGTTDILTPYYADCYAMDSSLVMPDWVFRVF